MQYSSHFYFCLSFNLSSFVTRHAVWPVHVYGFEYTYFFIFFFVIYVNCSHFVIVLCIYARLTRVWDSLLWWGEIYGSVDCSEVSVCSSVEHSVKSINANVLCWNILNIIDDWFFLSLSLFAWYILTSSFVYLFVRFLFVR